MVNEVAAATEPVEAPKQASEAELMQQLDAALKSKDFKAVAKVSNEIAKFQKTKEQAELETKQSALAAVTDEVKKVITAALKPLVEIQFRLHKQGSVIYKC